MQHSLPDAERSTGGAMPVRGRTLSGMAVRRCESSRPRAACRPAMAATGHTRRGSRNAIPCREPAMPVRYPAPAAWPVRAVSRPGAMHFQLAASPSAPLPE